MSRIGTDEVEEEESDLGKTRVLDSTRRMPAAEAGQNVTAKQETEPEDDEPEIEELDDEPELPRMANHLMIEARYPKKVWRCNSDLKADTERNRDQKSGS